jgi:hypothetical protein
MEEKERRKEARARRREWEKTRRMEKEKSGFEKAVEESLKKGAEEDKRWKERWQGYLDGWEKLKALGADPVGGQTEKDSVLRNKISWPVESGRWKDVNKEGETSCVTLLWPRMQLLMKHNPTFGYTQDRAGAGGIQTRSSKGLGSLGIDEGVMQAVTAVFQVIDRMWSELRERKT